MKKFINLYLIEYALSSLARQKYKSIFIGVVFTTMIFLLSTVFFITNSIKYELDATVDSLPQIIVQKTKAGRVYEIEVNKIDSILAINGVNDAIARVWGYYYFEKLGVNFSLVGIDEYEQQYKNSFKNIVDKIELSSDENTDSMVVGRGVLEAMKKSYYKDYFNFIKSDGSIKKVNIAGSFDGDTDLESNDVIVMSKETLRDIFDISSDKATDIVVKVANPDEIPTVASKIKLMYPDYNVITNEDLKVSYQKIYDYKSGLFLALFVVSLFTFFIIVYDRVSGVSSQEKREIGVLKAIGWRIDDILKEKFYESFILSFLSYVLGVGLSIFFVYILQAPLLKNIFIGYSGLKPAFEIPFIFDLQTLFLVFFLSVPIYVAAIIIPSWRVATLEADEVMR